MYILKKKMAKTIGGVMGRMFMYQSQDHPVKLFCGLCIIVFQYWWLSADFALLYFRIIHPVKMVCGFIAISVAFGGFVYCTSSRWKARKFKREHPIISVILILLAGYLLVYMVGAVIVFMFGIAFPLLRKYWLNMLLICASFCCSIIKSVTLKHTFFSDKYNHLLETVLSILKQCFET